MIPEEIEIEIRNAVEAKVKELIINNFPFDDLNNYVGELLRHHLNNTKTNTEQLVKTWHKWCEAHQIDNLSCGMATRKLVEMIEYQRAVVGPDVWIARKKLEELKSEWVKDQIPEAIIQSHAGLFIAGWNLCVENLPPLREQVILLPKEEIEPTEKTADNVDRFRFARTWNRCLAEIRALNPSYKCVCEEPT